ncbi:uncharacterized protein PRCAT00003044001 [Priceomyces carsonii]|uniref:uncharacterized protein n=1 Tax=Priceomyces carsonii TaxID=28549 RepID=UPI002ED89B33|nr:unnamed protein product [Priceomyces carsonii]
MIHRIISCIIRTIVVSFLIWIVLSTILPQWYQKYTNKEIQTGKFKSSSYPYSSLKAPKTNPIQNSLVYFIIAHPDDEVMFFSPSLIESIKPKNNNRVKLICLSNGDFLGESMGKIRTKELYRSAQILGLQKEDVTILSSFKDGMNETWSVDDILNELKNYIEFDNDKLTSLITFDEKGISSHPNHIAAYYGTRRFMNRNADKSVKMYALKSFNFWEKYSFTLLTNLELFLEHATRLIGNFSRINIHIRLTNRNIDGSSIKYYADLNMLSVGYAAMSYGHFSQMIWFRYGWLVLSRYLTMNHLIQIYI